MADLFVSWQDYIDLNEQLVLKVADSGWKFDSLLCLARGGMRPGDIFSRVYSKPLSVLSTSSYRAMSGTVQGELNISSCITGTEALKGKVLLVDDMVDSGITLEKVVKHLKSDFPEITECSGGRNALSSSRIISSLTSKGTPGSTSRSRLMTISVSSGSVRSALSPASNPA